jgi:zinc protease
MKTKNLLLISFLAMLLFFGCAPKESGELKIEYKKHTLENGLDVILHQDKSDPIVAVAIQYHVGSNRETPGKTGFAHLFEHMMFQESENVGQDQFFRLIQGAGGTLNGGTNKDGTVYYEVVPKNALEMVLWLESDRMGYLTNTVTASAFANQQNVVQNEKRQSYDNRPYGHMSYVLDKNLYPEGHPYSWQVIGEMEDLLNATVEDVIEFHDAFYVPNNATLTIAGDFDEATIMDLVEKYFGEIPSGEKVVDMEPVPFTVEATKKFSHEDNFARTPQITMVWPSVEQYNPDAYPLDFLAELLGSGKKAPMYKVLVKDKKLTSRVSVYNGSMELAGTFRISVNGNPGTPLSEIEGAINEAFEMFETEGFTDQDIERLKAGLETGFYNGISSVLGKSFQLARYNEYAGDPGFITEDLARIQAVTKEDVLRVYDKYIKGKPFVAASFVPKGQANLIADGSVDAGIVEENILEATEVDQAAVAEEEVIEKTPTLFDRTMVPEIGPDPEMILPEVWTGEIANGIKIWGIYQNEVPLVQYSIVIDGGHLLDLEGKSGTASMLASMLMEGTALKTPEELEEAIDLLGASIRTYGSTESITISVNTLARNFEKTIDLVEEILLQPRWDEEQFALAKSNVINGIERNRANPGFLASEAFNNLLYGKEHILAQPVGGTKESVESMEMDDLKEFYERVVSPTITRFHIAGDINKDRVESALAGIAEAWPPKEVVMPEIVIPENSVEAKIYFIDVPGAKQSVIQIGNLSLPRSDPDFYATEVVNYKLGGSFNGYLNLILREEKGFTYGARSGFSGNRTSGTFSASSSVRTTATLESVQIFKEEMEKYREDISEEDLNFTKNSLLKSNALRFETLGALLGMLSEITTYNLPFDYARQEEIFVRDLTREKHIEIAQKYIDPSKMYFIVAGDAATQLDGLKAIGLGNPILIK